MEQTKQLLTDEDIEEVKSENTQAETKQDEADVEDINETSNDEKDEIVLSEEQIKIETLEKDLQQLNDRYLRVQADYDNFRRRSKQEREAAAKYRAQSLIEDIIPVVDNFERALNMKAESEEAKSILQGMDMIYRQLNEALKNEGLEVIKAVGEPFDPNFHQAIAQVQTDEFEANCVTEELQKGYILKDRVIRPSMVKVNQ